MLMNTTLRAAVHLGKDCDTNLRFVKSYLWKTAVGLFYETTRLISDQSEILGPKTSEIVGLKTIGFGKNYVEIDKLILRKSLSDHQC